MKKHIWVFAALVLALTLTGCGKNTVPEKYTNLLSDKSGKYVKLGFYGAPEQINPIKAPEFSHDQMFSNLIFAAPLRKTEDGSYVPYLFESYETKLDGEQVVLSGKWRKGLKWHDGKDFETIDFDYNISQMKEPENNSPYLAAVNGIVSMNNTSEGIEIRFAHNSVKYMDMLCAGLLPAHLLDEKNIASGTSLKENNKKFWEKPVGMGPYKVADNTSMRYFELEPFAEFFDGKGATRPNIVIACSYELQQSISDFRENMLDWIDIPSVVGEQLQNLGIEKVVYMQYPNPAVMTWVFNTKNEKLKDVKVRKALNLIIDRNCAKQYLGADCIELLDNLVPADVKEKNVEKAFEEGVKLLGDAGVVDTNSDGIREYNGNAFKLKIMINDDNMTRRLIAEKMVERLKEAGIESEIESVPWTEFISGRLKNYNYDTALLSYHIADDYGLSSLFSTRTGEDAENLNYTGISDEELDSDLKILNSIVTDEDKAVVAKRVNEKLSKLSPCAFLVRPNSLALIHGEEIATLRAKTAFWNDVFNWKLMFGKEDSSL